MTSEFGKGYSYCLGLFLAHSEREILKCGGVTEYSLWFNGAGDHIFEFEATTEREIAFKNKVLNLRLDTATKQDYYWALKEAKELLMEYDKKNGFEVIKGDYE